MLLSPEAFEVVQKGGVIFLLVVAIIWLVSDRNRLLESLRSKDAAIEKKDGQLLAVTKETILLMTELKALLGGRGAGT